MQYRGDGIASRGAGYGIHTIRVDGSDVWAVLVATREARRIATGGDGTGRTKPVLIEAMTYREGHHSTSDDSTRYRSSDEVAEWRDHSNPVRRLRRYLERRGWWDSEKEEALLLGERRDVLQAMATAEKKGRHDFRDMFTDVYAPASGTDAALPTRLEEQYAALSAHVRLHPAHYDRSEH